MTQVGGLVIISHENSLVEISETLADLGFVKRFVFKKAVDSFLVSRGRMAKEWKTRKPINLLEGPPWRKKWIKSLFVEVARECREKGFTVVDTELIEGKLINATYILDAIGRLRLGFGIEVCSPCGCQAKVAKVAWSKREETIIVPFKMCRRHKPRR